MQQDSQEKRLCTKQFIISISPMINGQEKEYLDFFQSSQVNKLVKDFADMLDDLARNEISKIASKKQAGIEAYKKNNLAQRELYSRNSLSPVLNSVQQSDNEKFPLIPKRDESLMHKPPYIPSAISSNKSVEIKPVFKIQNFKVNQEKKVKIDIDSFDNISISEVRFSSDIGLSYNSATKEIEGVPNQAGDFMIYIKWSNGKGGSATESLNLSVVDDPKNLWKNLESDKDDQYYKEDQDAKCIEDEDKVICVGSIRGRSHAHVGSFRDDDFFVYKNNKDNWSILIVADGAGSAKYSRQGSSIACKIAGELIRSKIESTYSDIIDKINEYDMADNGRKLKEEFYYLLGHAFRSAVESITAEAQSKNIAIREFSTTLLASICFQFNNKLFVASAMIGDGAIGIYFKDTNKINILGEPDSGEFAGQTRFLDISTINDGSFWERVNIGMYDKPTALLLMTDGISDPIFETDNGLKDANLWKNLWLKIEPIVRSKGPEREQELLNWMGFFSTGHHDDRTLAIYGLK